MPLPVDTVGPLEVELVAYELTSGGVFILGSTTFSVVPEPGVLACLTAAAGLLL